MTLEFGEGALFPGLVFFLPPEVTFDIGDVAEFSGLNGDSYFDQKREHEETGCPDTEGHHEFQEIWHVNVDLTQGIRHKSRNDETRPFLNPHPNDDKKASEIEGS